jgi:hypothetical protein
VRQLARNSARRTAQLQRWPNVFPVLPIKKTFTTKLNSGSKSLTVKLTQFPLVPTSAITVHKVQGQSLDRVIVTKWRDPKMVSQYPMTAYVTLSRVRTLAASTSRNRSPKPTARSSCRRSPSSTNSSASTNSNRHSSDQLTPCCALVARPPKHDHCSCCSNRRQRRKSPPRRNKNRLC